jgi:hypothetical protein
VVAGLFLLLTVGAPIASADTFNFTGCDVTGGCGTATNFGTVTLTQNGANVDFDVVLTTGNRFVETGAGGEALFVFNDALSGSAITNMRVTLDGATVTLPNGLVGETGIGSPGLHADGTGYWSASISCGSFSDCNGGSAPNLNDLHFTVTNATLAQLETANGAGNLFATDILLGQTGGPGGTGPVTVPGGTVPDGGMTLMLLGGALVGLETLRRRVRA